jgi:hypothetical protein
MRIVILIAVFFSLVTVRAEAFEDSRAETIDIVLSELGTYATVVETPRWTIDLDLIIWLPISMNGSSTVAGLTAPIDLRFDQIFEFFEIGGQIRAEAWRGRWGIIADAMYLSLGADARPSTPGPLTPGAEVDLQQWNVDLLGGYRAMQAGDEKRPIFIDVLFGARWVDLKQTIELNSGTTLGQSEQWVDIVVGGQFGAVLTDRWSLMMRFDVGGFGIGNSSQLTWNLVAGFTYQFGKERAPGRNAYAVKFGWRIYDIDYTTGSGGDEFGMDMTVHGPYFSFTFQW